MPDAPVMYRERGSTRRVLALLWTGQGTPPPGGQRIPVGYWLTRDEHDRFEAIPPGRFAAEYVKETGDG